MLNLIEKINLLGEEILAHREGVQERAKMRFDNLEIAAKSFYNDLFKRYSSILIKTRKIHNACTQYRLDCGYGELNIGLAITGFFSSVVGCSVYSFGNFCLCGVHAKKTDPEQITKLTNFFSHVNWDIFDKQITIQFSEYLLKYEEETNKMNNF